jgi:hypothetical protein
MDFLNHIDAGAAFMAIACACAVTTAIRLLWVRDDDD